MISIAKFLENEKKDHEESKLKWNISFKEFTETVAEEPRQFNVDEFKNSFQLFIKNEENQTNASGSKLKTHNFSLYSELSLK